MILLDTSRGRSRVRYVNIGTRALKISSVAAAI